MTNGEKYKTAEERTEAFKEYCSGLTGCGSCKHKNPNAPHACAFLWLNANTEPSIAEIIAEMRSKTAIMGNAWYTLEGWRKLCDSLDAAAKRAYERIDNEMRGNFHSDCTDVALMRSVMDETIGVYHG